MHAFVYSYAGMHASVYTKRVYMFIYACIRTCASTCASVHVCSHSRMYSYMEPASRLHVRVGAMLCAARATACAAPGRGAARRAATAAMVPTSERPGRGRAARPVFLSPSSLSPLSSSTSLRTPCPRSRSWTPTVPEEAFGPLDFFSMIPTGRS